MSLNSVVTNQSAMIALQMSWIKQIRMLSVVQKQVSTGYRVADAVDDGAAAIAGHSLDHQRGASTTMSSPAISRKSSYLARHERRY